MYQQTRNDKRNLKLADKAFNVGDRVTALKYYLKAAEVGIVSAMLDCGRIYFEGVLGVEKNIEKSLEWLNKAADLGSSSAMNNIGYILGTLGKHDESVIWYEKAANLGDVVATLNLSNVYRQFYNNQTMSKYWLKKAESFQDTESIRKVADYYFQEDFLTTHIDKAIALYYKAINLGDIDAYKELGDLFFEIDDFENAHDIYRDGANAGNVDCMVDLGMMLIYAPKCYEPAYYWLCKAISKGDIYAVKVLGELYEEYGNYPKALRCYRKAIHLGVNDARECLTNVKKLLKKHKANYKMKLRKV